MEKHFTPLGIRYSESNATDLGMKQTGVRIVRHDNVSRGTVLQMVHAIKHRADVLEHILRNPIVTLTDDNPEITQAEKDHVYLLDNLMDDLKRYLGMERRS